MNRRMGFLAAGGLAVALVAGGGTALAAATGPVSGTGVITGCYTNAAVNGSHALVLQNGGTSCPSGTSAISWDQTGPQGPAGPAGTNGTNGTDGTNGTSIVTSVSFPPSPCTTGDTDVDLTNGDVYTCSASAWVPTGSSIEGPQGPAGTGATVTPGAPAANCPDGGVTVTDGSGDTSYVCDGAPGAAGPAGTNGNTILNGSGPPSGTVGSVGDFYIDTAADVLYGPMTSSGWPATGVSLTGPAGPAGTGATVTPLSPGNANCANGGAQISDGNGNTAYACNGATGPAGSADVDTFLLDVTWDSSSDAYTCEIFEVSGPDASNLSVSATSDDCEVTGFAVTGAFPPFALTPQGTAPPVGGDTGLTMSAYATDTVIHLAFRNTGGASAFGEYFMFIY